MAGPIAGRTDHRRVDDLVGSSSKTLCCAPDNSEQSKLPRAPRRGCGPPTLGGLYGHPGGMPFEGAGWEVLNPARSLARHSLFQVMAGIPQQTPPFDLRLARACKVAFEDGEHGRVPSSTWRVSLGRSGARRTGTLHGIEACLLCDRPIDRSTNRDFWCSGLVWASKEAAVSAEKHNRAIGGSIIPPPRHERDTFCANGTTRAWANWRPPPCPICSPPGGRARLTLLLPCNEDANTSYGR